MLILAVYSAPLTLEARQPLVHGSDVAFTVWTDQTPYSMGESIAVHYAVKNVSNGALFVPKSQAAPPYQWMCVIADRQVRHCRKSAPIGPLAEVNQSVGPTA
jgi:hypothetical protein